MRILSVGNMDGVSNTCRFRNMALMRIADHVDVVNTSYANSLLYKIAYHLYLYGIPVNLPDHAHANGKIRKYIKERQYDIIWIDKGVTILPSTLRFVRERQPSIKLISYSPDNMSLRHNSSRQFEKGLSLYDYHLTVSRPGLEEILVGMGARKVLFLNKGYESSFHHPYHLTEQETKYLGGDVGFIGSWEEKRCRSVMYLADHGIRVKVWGKGKWKEYAQYSPNLTITGVGLYDENYPKAFCAFKISLCFLRHMNSDTYTSRSYEIPACGGFMLAERTEEHKRLFEEDKEAAYFSSNEELLEKCKYYLEHEEERKAIAMAGYQRCIDSDYSNEGMIREVLSRIVSNTCKLNKEL